MIVLDASAYCEALLRPPSDPLRQRLGTVSLVHVPDGFDIEVVNVLRRLWLRGAISAEEGAT